MKYVGIIILSLMFVLNPNESKSQTAYELFDMGKNASDEGKHFLAIKYFSEGYKKAEKDKVNYLLFRGIEYYKTGSHQKAILDLSAFLEVYNSAILAYTYRADAKEKLADIVGAINDYTKAINLVENGDSYSKSNLYYKRALLKFDSGGIYNIQDVRKDIDKAITLNPKDPGIYFVAGITYAGFNTALEGDDKQNRIKGCSYLSKASEMGSKKAIESIKELCN